MKNVKKILLIAAVLSCAAIVGVIITINNSGPLSNLNNYRGTANTPGEISPNQNSGEQDKTNSWSGNSEFNIDLEKDIINDRHKQIALNYKSRFAQLQSEYQGELNNMLKSAKADLDRAKRDESTASLVKLAYSYINRGKSMESECDDRFYSLLNDMEKELRRENLPAGLVNEAEKEYERLKSQRREHLMSTAKEYIKG